MEQQGHERLTPVSGLVYGVQVRGLLPAGFQPYLGPAHQSTARPLPEVDVTFRVVPDLPEVSPIWASEPVPGRAGRTALFNDPAGFGMTVEGDGDGLFRVGNRAIAVEWLPGAVGAARCFYSYALPLWLESRSVPVLHASAVALEDRAVAFVGPSGIGKSTLCAGLLRTGFRFVADDALPLYEDESGDWRCASGPPWIRLWPSALERRLGIAASSLPRVQGSLDKRMLSCAEVVPGSGTAGPRLGAVYVLGGLTELPEGVTMTACSARDSLVQLIEHSLAGAPVAALGWSARRLGLLSRVAARTPVRRLRYPTGDDSWQRVHRAIADDLAASATPPARDR